MTELSSLSSMFDYYDPRNAGLDRNLVRSRHWTIKEQPLEDIPVPTRNG